jgi:hypothetical protein
MFMKLPKAFIIMLCIAGLLSSCELIENADKHPKATLIIIAALPLYIVYQGIIGIAAADDAITLYTKDFVKEAGGCLTPYDASLKDITDHVFVISDPVHCVDKDSPIRFNDNNIYRTYALTPTKEAAREHSKKRFCRCPEPAA